MQSASRSLCLCRCHGRVPRRLQSSSANISAEQTAANDAWRIQRLAKLGRELSSQRGRRRKLRAWSERLQAQSGEAPTRLTRLRGVGTWIDQLAVRHGQAAELSAPHIALPETRKMSDSFLCYDLPFEDDEELHERYVGGATSIRIGRLMEDLDSLAGSVSYRHVLPDNASIADARAAGIYLVTAAVDRLDMLRPLLGTENLRLSGHISYTSRSSMEVLVKLESVSRARGLQDNPEAILVGRFTMACRNAKTAKAHPIPQLVVQGADEEALWELGKEQKDRKQRLQSQALDVAPPSAVESARLHHLFYNQATLFKRGVATPPDVVWMKDSGLSSALMMHPQERNVHGAIFGGYLMRLAYETAYSTACLFARAPVTFLALDELAFKRPVAIGSLLRLTSKVTFAPIETGHRSFHVSVEASTVNLRTSEELVTNVFHYTFTSDRALERHVLPRSYPEAIVWLDAIRRRQIGLQLRRRIGVAT